MNDVLAVMQDDWVMMALPFFFGALFIEVIWAYRSHTQHYESVDFWTSMRVMPVSYTHLTLPTNC